VANNDDAIETGTWSRVCFHVDASTTYRIAVDGFADDEGAIELSYGPKVDAAPCATLPPAIVGPASPKVGDQLGLGAGSYTDAGSPSIADQWERCVELECSDIAGATGTSYSVQQRDVGTAIRVHEIVTTGSGTASSDAAPTSAVSLTPTTHTNGRIYWLTKTLVASFTIDSELPDGTGLLHVGPTGVAPSFRSMPSVSPDGTLVAFANLGAGGHIETMSADGSNVHDLGVAGTWPTWSPDGTRIAFVSTDGIDSVDLNGDETLLVPFAPGQLTGPMDWSPDGSKIAFTLRYPGHADLDVAVVAANGMGPITQLTTSPADDQDPSWSPTGDRIAFERAPNTGPIVDSDLYVMNADGSAQTLLYDGNPGSASPATNLARGGTDWSPDGTKILFSLDSGFGTNQMYTIPSGGGPATQLPGDGYQNNLVSWGVAVAAPAPGGGGGGGSGGGGGGGRPNLNVGFSAQPPAGVGSPISLYVVVGNKGDVAFHTTLTVTTSGLSGVGVVSLWGFGQGCNAANGTVTCDLVSLPPASTPIQVALVGGTVTGSTVSATATLSGTNLADTDTSDDQATFSWSAPSPAASTGPSPQPTTTAAGPTPKPKTFPLTVVIEPGRKAGTVHIGGIRKLTGGGNGYLAGRYAAGSSLTLTARPAPGWRFGKWQGSCSGAKSICTLRMASARTVTALFERVKPRR
jgi:hypothetical protein